MWYYTLKMLSYLPFVAFVTARLSAHDLYITLKWCFEVLKVLKIEFIRSNRWSHINIPPAELVTLAHRVCKTSALFLTCMHRCNRCWFNLSKPTKNPKFSNPDIGGKKDEEHGIWLLLQLFFKLRGLKSHPIFKIQIHSNRFQKT